MLRNLGPLVLAACATTLWAGSLTAEENTVTPNTKVFENAPQPGAALWQAEAASGYVGGGATTFRGANRGDSDAFNFSLQASTRFSLSDKWFMQLGLGSANFYLGRVSGAPVPEDIHTLRAEVGLGYRWDEKWTFTALLGPTLYRLEDIDINDFGLAGGLLARYQAKPSLTFSVGVMVAPDSDVKAMPLVGVRWLINDHYTLEVGMPKTRLSYRLQPKWALYAGLDLNGSTFRTSERFGTDTGFSRYNNALATYRDLRLGVGTGYEFARGLRVEVEAGVSVYHEIYYSRIAEQVSFDPAAYVRIGLNGRF